MEWPSSAPVDPLCHTNWNHNRQPQNQDPKINPNSYPDSDANPNQHAIFRREGKQK